MKQKEIEFKAPEGMEVPQGLAVGETFEAMATVKLGEDGELYLTELDGMPLSSESEDMEEEMGSEEDMSEGEMEEEAETEEIGPEVGFLEAIERRATPRA